MSAPTVSVNIGEPREVVFNLATLIRIEKATGKTPVAHINELAAQSAVPAEIPKDQVTAWLESPAGKEASAKAVERISPTEVNGFIAACTGLDPAAVADTIALDEAYEAYNALQAALVEATKQLLRTKEEPDSPPPQAG
ncbi:MAG TPA: hypothetical protein VK176_08305 [Phycisphaerales bacterium]|nr:hypothetical protein [Phycisphaerales bacterium]